MRAVNPNNAVFCVNPHCRRPIQRALSMCPFCGTSQVPNRLQSSTTTSSVTANLIALIVTLAVVCFCALVIYFIYEVSSLYNQDAQFRKQTGSLIGSISLTLFCVAAAFYGIHFMKYNISSVKSDSGFAALIGIVSVAIGSFVPLLIVPIFILVAFSCGAFAIYKAKSDPEKTVGTITLICAGVLLIVYIALMSDQQQRLNQILNGRF